MRKSQQVPPSIAAITHHYYFGGPPSNPDINLDRLLHPDPKVASVAATTHDAAQQLGVVYRMSEGNTCYKGGKPGVSDVFGASLWAADYLLTLASLGYSGVNLHGGGGKAVADSLGGTLPGEALMPDPSIPHPRPFYTPIADMDGRSVAEPVFYGMRFAEYFAGCTMIPIDFDPGTVNAVAYAAKKPTLGTIIAIINKDTTQDLAINFNGNGERKESNRLWRDETQKLTAKSHLQLVQSLTATSLGSRSVRLIASSNHAKEVIVPAASAILFRIGSR